LDDGEVEDLLDLRLEGSDLELVSVDQTVLLVEEGLESCNVLVLASEGDNIGSEDSDLLGQSLDVSLESQDECLFLLECELECFVVGLPFSNEGASGLQLNLEVHHLGKIGLADRVLLGEDSSERGDDGLQLEDGLVLGSPLVVEESDLALVPGDVALGELELDHELVVSLAEGIHSGLELEQGDVVLLVLGLKERDSGVERNNLSLGLLELELGGLELDGPLLAEELGTLELSGESSVLGGKGLVSSLGNLSALGLGESGDLGVEGGDLGLVSSNLGGILVDLSGQLSDPESQGLELLGINLSLEEGVESLELGVASPEVVNLDLQGIHGSEVDSDELLSAGDLLGKLESKSGLRVSAGRHLSGEGSNLSLQGDGTGLCLGGHSGNLSLEGSLSGTLGSDGGGELVSLVDDSSTGLLESRGGSYISSEGGELGVQSSDLSLNLSGRFGTSFRGSFKLSCQTLNISAINGCNVRAEGGSISSELSVGNTTGSKDDGLGGK